MQDEIEVGDKIKFLREGHAYTVKGRNDRYLICTKPFNVKKTYIYTIVDLEEQVRGRDNYTLGRYDYSVPEEVEECLIHLASGVTAVSYKYRVPLDIEKVKKARK